MSLTIHGHDLSKVIKIGFEYTLDDDGLPTYGPEREFEGELRPESSYDVSAFKKLDSVRVQFLVAVDDEGSPFVKKYVVWVNGELVASIRRVSKSGNAFLYHFAPIPVLAQGSSPEADVVFQLAGNFPGQRFRGIIDEALSRVKEHPEFRPRAKVEFSEEEHEVDKENFKQEMLKMMEEKGDDFLSNEGNVENEGWRIEIPDSSSVPEWGKLLNVPHFIEWQNSFENTVEPFVVTALLSTIIAGPGELIAKELEQMRYIGPIRAIPPRNYLPQKTSTSGRWADGMAGWDVLLNDIVAGKTWFEQSTYDRLNLGYEFVGCRELTVSDELLEKLAETPLKDVIPKVTGKNTVRMRDVKSKTDVEPCDVGTGVSQVIPVVAGAMAPGCRFLSVEQPELHLHPAIQCNLGDLFISQMRRYPERTFLLETHSEHLILRLLRRIRETSEKKLRGRNKKFSLRTDDVGVLYVEEVKAGVRIKELLITDDGDFAEKWPQGFFDERAEELF